MYTLYSMQRSGNSYKVRLALAQLGIPYRLIEIDILKGESRTPEFLAKNPHGQVPLLEAEPGRYLAESNAMLSCCGAGNDTAGSGRTLMLLLLDDNRIVPELCLKPCSVNSGCSSASAEIVTRGAPNSIPAQAAGSSTAG